VQRFVSEEPPYTGRKTTPDWSAAQKRGPRSGRGLAIGLRGAELQSREGEAHPALCKYRSARCDRGLWKRGSSEPVSTSTPTIARTAFEFSAAKQIATNLLVATNSASGVPNITLLFEVSRCANLSSWSSHRACRVALRI
jgi:hypothetical protein